MQNFIVVGKAKDVFSFIENLAKQAEAATIERKRDLYRLQSLKLTSSLPVNMEGFNGHTN